MQQKIAGFNLLELMITLAIIGILSVLSVPTYFQHLIRARRLEAETGLIKLASALEKYYFMKNTYEKATLNELNIAEIIADNQYQLQITSATRSDFSIKAIPLDKQAEKDSQCASLIFDSTGNKKITGTGDLNECWPS